MLLLQGHLQAHIQAASQHVMVRRVTRRYFVFPFNSSAMRTRLRFLAHAKGQADHYFICVSIEWSLDIVIFTVLRTPTTLFLATTAKSTVVMTPSSLTQLPKTSSTVIFL